MCLLDEHGTVMKLVMVSYQFEDHEHRFTIKAHGNSKQNKPYRRTNDSTIKAIKAKVIVDKPRRVFQTVAEQLGDGLLKGTQPSAWPRDMTQIYNLKKTDEGKSTSKSVSAKDPYFALILQCKEDQSNPETAFVRRVTVAPEPTALLAFDYQLADMVKFCTKPSKFSVLQVDPTFDLGPFHVTATQYENLHLLDRRSGKHPAMLGPIYIHRQKKELTYDGFVSQLIELKPELNSIKAIGTDGEEALYNAFVKRIENLIHLRCFLHERQNIDRHLKAIGVSEHERKDIIADIFGRQVGSTFKEGILDSDSAEEFWLRLTQLERVWAEHTGKKGKELHSWVMKYKADEMVISMLRPVRTRARLGDPPLHFTTNRVECINSLLSDETDHRPQSLPQFTKIVRELVERQRKNVEWAIIDKGPYRLLPTLHNHQVTEELWCSMTVVEREQHLKRLFNEHVKSIYSEPGQPRTVVPTACTTSADTSNISPEANEVPSASEPPIVSLTLEEFERKLERYLHKETAIGIWRKASRLLIEPNNISIAPGCHTEARMVASSSNNKPHLVSRGKEEGHFKCEKSCANWSGIAMCSHTLAAAAHNQKTAQLLEWYCTYRAKNAAKLSGAVVSNMPENPGKKPGVTRRKGKKATHKITEREQRVPLDPPRVTATVQSNPPNSIEIPPASAVIRSTAINNSFISNCSNNASQTPHFNANPISHPIPQYPNPPPIWPGFAMIAPVGPGIPLPPKPPIPFSRNPYYIKKITGKISVCNGCGNKFRAPGVVPPDDSFVVCRKEREYYPHFNDDRTKSWHIAREQNRHYHLFPECILKRNPLFSTNSITCNAEITPDLRQAIRTRFGVII